jgi:hypothetical protein
MTDGKPDKVYADRVQLAYAKTLDFVSHAIIVVMAAGYAFYLLRLLPNTIPIELIARNWGLNSSDLRSQLHHHCGWSCFSSIPALLHGDALSYASVIFLSMATMLCLITALFAFLAEKNRIFMVMAIMQILVLGVAASGVFATGR